MKRTYLLVISLLLYSVTAYCQKLNGKKLETGILNTIEKAYPASIRMWEFDTVAQQRMSAQFSGVVVTSDGVILTAAHVTIPGKTYKVMFPDGRDCIAVALGKIELTSDKTIPDVAKMKIVTKGTWPYAAIGRSSALKTFEPCISIAYPESMNQDKPAVRFGYISKVRNERGFVQSTCIMEPGDSGGPLFDYAGRVIGLHSAIEIAEDLNFEVPVDLYKKYWTALDSERVYHVYPGTTDSLKKYPVNPQAGSVPLIKKISAAYSDVASAVKGSSLSIMSNLDGKERKVTGTLFSLSGVPTLHNVNQTLVVSKSSLVGNLPILIVDSKKRIGAKILARDRDNDLVLLEPSVEIKGGIRLEKLYTSKLEVIPGKLLISAQPDTASTYSITSTQIFNSPKITNAGFFGAAIAFREEGPLLITVVQPNSPASNGGFKVGDRLLSINGATMNKPGDYGEQLQKYWPGDTLVFDIKRSEEELEKKIVLGVRPQFKFNHPAELFAGGKSDRRDGFDKVFSHDAIITPYRCGGPVFDLAGNFCGINIARYSRASCLTIPGATIYQFIEKSVKKNFLSEVGK